MKRRPPTSTRTATLFPYTTLFLAITASVRPWDGRTLPSSSGSQSIWFLNTPVTLPCRSGETQTWPSDHCDHSRVQEPEDRKRTRPNSRPSYVSRIPSFACNKKIDKTHKL